ncbi:MAG: hemerythrin domain-containing protein, partial [Trebonia sp.]
MQMTGVIDTRLIHDVHRTASTLLAEAASGPGASAAALAEVRDFLVNQLRYHHQAEDDLLWPMITAQAPELAGPFARLSGEHDKLEATLDALAAAPVGEPERTALADAAIAVWDLVHVHLGHEEPVLLPALRDHVSEQAWKEFAQHVRATAPDVGTHLLVGFLEEVGAPEEVAIILARMPAPARAALREQAQDTFARLTGQADHAGGEPAA